MVYQWLDCRKGKYGMWRSSTTPWWPWKSIKQKSLLHCRRPFRLSFAGAKSYHILLSFVIYCSVGRTSIEIGICRKLCLFGQYIVSASLNFQLSGNPCWYHYFAISIWNCFPSAHTSRMLNQQKYWKISNYTDDLVKCEMWTLNTWNVQRRKCYFSFLK